MWREAVWPRTNTKKSTEQTATCGGRSSDPPSCSLRLLPRPICGESTQHLFLANASANSCLTLSVIDSNSPGARSSLPRHMASEGVQSLPACMMAHFVAHLKVYSRLGKLVGDDDDLRPTARSIADLHTKWREGNSKDEEWCPDRFTRGPDGGQAIRINAT